MVWPRRSRGFGSVSGAERLAATRPFGPVFHFFLEPRDPFVDPCFRRGEPDLLVGFETGERAREPLIGGRTTVASRASSAKRRCCVLSSKAPGFMSLMMRTSSRWTCRARYTSPIPPSPSLPRISYFPSRISPVFRTITSAPHAGQNRDADGIEAPHESHARRSASVMMLSLAAAIMEPGRMRRPPVDASRLPG